ncbi:hypothetical protein QQ045_008521 [Rhodiola kirilowii]
METDVRERMIVKSEEEDMETYSLLAQPTGGMTRNGEKRRLSVQWNDANGNKLAEILEFQPRCSCYCSSIRVSA